MQKISKNKNLIELSDELSASQKRSFRTLIALLQHVSTTCSEEDFFESSSDILKLFSTILNQSHFNQELRPNPNIRYDQQAVEFSIENLMQALEEDKAVSWDN